MPKKKKKQRFGITRNPNFSKFYATNVLVYRTDVDFRLEVLNERFTEEDEEKKEVIERFVSDALVIFTPEAAKKLKNVLEKLISEYEKEKGEIAISKGREIP